MHIHLVIWQYFVLADVNHVQIYVKTWLAYAHFFVLTVDNS